MVVGRDGERELGRGGTFNTAILYPFARPQLLVEREEKAETIKGFSELNSQVVTALTGN